MWQRNRGQSEDEILQNSFTAYLARAVHNHRNDYIAQAERRNQMEELTESFSFDAKYAVEDIRCELPFMMQLGSSRLFCAIKQVDARERYVFLARVLDEKSFELLAEELGLSYKGAAAVYYRTIRKMKKKMEEMKDEF